MPLHHDEDDDLRLPYQGGWDSMARPVCPRSAVMGAGWRWIGRDGCG
jgi:hypothetical protein